MVAIDHLKKILILAFVTLSLVTQAQDNLLKRKISVRANSELIEDVLLGISNEGKFTFSYDATIFTSLDKVSFSSDDGSVKSALDKVLPKGIEYKVSGNHLILFKKPDENTSGKRVKYTISGHVYDATSKIALKNIIVYEVSSLVSSVTNDQGQFSMLVPAQYEQLGLSFTQIAIKDTVILIIPEDQVLSISLSPVKHVALVQNVKITSVESYFPLDSSLLVQRLVSSQSLSRTGNAQLILRRPVQVSFLPSYGTNLKMDGFVQNDFSLNICGGYSHSINFFELAGFFNITRTDVNRVQVGGLANIVGGSVKGFQLAGLTNILKGSIKGAQIAGLYNTSRSVEGVQIGGLVNFSHGSVRKIQIAGLVNYGSRVDGVQIAGLVNIAEGEIQGFQLAGLINKAGKVNAIQFAGIGNISTDTVSGKQVSGIFNYTRYIKGNQIGLFNISDSSSGTPVGLVSFVKKGFRAVEFSATEVTPANVSFKTGVKAFYNIFSGGYGSWKGERRWSFGYGFGAEKPISNQLLFNLEYTANWINEGHGFQKDLNLLNRFDFIFGVATSKRMRFLVGPSVNILLSEVRDFETGDYLTQLAPYTFVDQKIGTTLFQMWVGGKVAVQF